jgi:hypothetical protein
VFTVIIRVACVHLQAYPTSALAFVGIGLLSKEGGFRKRLLLSVLKVVSVIDYHDPRRPKTIQYISIIGHLIGSFLKGEDVSKAETISDP